MGYSIWFIEGDTGIIVVDAGWFPTPTANAMKLLREYTNKPIAAVIYPFTWTTTGAFKRF